VPAPPGTLTLNIQMLSSFPGCFFFKELSSYPPRTVGTWEIWDSAVAPGHIRDVRMSCPTLDRPRLEYGLDEGRARSNEQKPSLEGEDLCPQAG
jgi:hypothetical protein